MFKRSNGAAAWPFEHLVIHSSFVIRISSLDFHFYMSAPLQIDQVPLALLAGGLATRLGTIARNMPKALIDVAGKPFIDRQMELLHRNGIRHVIICLGHLGGQIRDHLGDGTKLGMQLEYSEDGPRPLGTGGAVRAALDRLGEIFWVMYGDSYLDIDYRAILSHFDRSGADALMTVLRNDNRWDRSNVQFSDGRLLRYDKAHPTADMNFIDYGAALLRRRAMADRPADQPFDLADLYSRLVAQGRMIGYEVTRRFYEIGTAAALEETRAYFQGR
jgi:NDP-sugar pyrophosphorylase family protein